MKSYAGFRFVPIPMTLNNLERCNSPYFAFSPNSIALLADYVTVVKDRPIISVKYCLPVPVLHFRPKLMYAAARSFCDSWASCYINFVLFSRVLRSPASYVHCKARTETLTQGQRWDMSNLRQCRHQLNSSKAWGPTLPFPHPSPPPPHPISFSRVFLPSPPLEVGP